MRNVLAGALMAAAVVALNMPAFAAVETITGKVVDQACYMKDMANNHAADHKMPADVAGCAAACAKKGMPLALLTTDGKVYTIAGGLAAENNAKLIPHIAHTVAITGDVMTMDGKMTITAAELKMVSR
jgi:hypothetical protein